MKYFESLCRTPPGSKQNRQKVEQKVFKGDIQTCAARSFPFTQSMPLSEEKKMLTIADNRGRGRMDLCRDFGLSIAAKD